MKAIVQGRAGEPRDALELVEIPEVGALGDDEVLIDVRLAMLHFADFFVIRKAKPAQANAERRGLEAYGVVAAVGANVPGNIRVGGRVAIFSILGTWGERVVAPASRVIPVPDAIPDETAAQLFVQAVTALMVLRDIRRSIDDEALRHGTVILTGAGSLVARMLARFMLDDGLSVIGLTRSHQGVSRAKALAPDVTYLSTGDADWKAQVRTAAAGRPIVAIADCVGGGLVGEVAELLQDNGLISTYGGLAPEPLGLNGLQIAARGLEIRGVTIRRWFTAAEEVRQADIAAAKELALRHPGIFPAAALVPLKSFRDAMDLLEQPGRDGAVMLKI